LAFKHILGGKLGSHLIYIAIPNDTTIAVLKKFGDEINDARDSSTSYVYHENLGE
jgi:hypothetical protein